MINISSKKVKSMNKSLVKTLFASVVAGTLMVSCGEERDLQKLWESKIVDSEFNEYFTETFGEVASDQDFHMVSQRTMNIANIGGDINTEYTVYVCQGNPHYEDDAMALYQTTAKGQSALSITFDMPIGLDHVWIVRSAPEDQVASYVTVSQTTQDIKVSLESEETKAQVSEATVNEVTDNLFDFTYVHSNIDGHTYTMSAAPSTAWPPWPNRRCCARWTRRTPTRGTRRWSAICWTRSTSSASGRRASAGAPRRWASPSRPRRPMWPGCPSPST